MLEGQIPNNIIFNNIIDLDDKGYIISDDGAIAAMTAINEIK